MVARGNDLWLGPTWAGIARWLRDLWQGVVLSLQVTGLTLLIGIPLGLVFALAANARLAVVRWAILITVEIGRGAPALLVIQFVYSGLPQAGLTAVPAGQREAAQKLDQPRRDQTRHRGPYRSPCRCPRPAQSVVDAGRARSGGLRRADADPSQAAEGNSCHPDTGRT
ncbi:ABC transporter permease subunit [Rhodobacteraceae bacterium]|nr:ABC transporter permease subunit [Paracoccaceae bacterium]